MDKGVARPKATDVDFGDGASVLIGDFGTSGMPNSSIDLLIVRSVGNLIIIINNARKKETGIVALISNGPVHKIICSFPYQLGEHHFDAAYRAGNFDLSPVPRINPAAKVQALDQLQRNFHADLLRHPAHRAKRQTGATAMLCSRIPIHARLSGRP